jgi:hypothetical protein
MNVNRGLLIQDKLKWLNSWRIISGSILASYFVVFAIRSFRWPWMGDAQVFHYEIFLMRAGMAPYRQIPDINMPGAYFSEFFGMSLFGGSDHAWRLYDFTILIALIVAAVSIASAYDWFAGLYAGVLFALIHGSEGPLMSAERDQVMTMLIILGFAFVFFGVRHRRSLFFFFSGITLALAATIKPTAIAFELLLTYSALLELKKQGVRIFPFLREIVTATMLIMLGTLAFLLWRGSLHAFVHQTLALGLTYSSVGRPSFSYMLHYSTPRGLTLLLPLGAVLFVSNRSWRNWEVRVIFCGIFLGLASYFLQAKGFIYHRYPFVAFALLWSGLEFVIALKKGRFTALVGGAGLLIGTLLVAPFYLYRVFHFEQPNSIAMGIVQDLKQYPLSQLQGRVQCLDGLAGCYSALYRLQLKQSTGLMGDQLLFSSHPNSIIRESRRDFLRQFLSSPPMIFVVTNYRFGDPQTFNKVNMWPEFADVLRHNYTLVTERTWGLPSQKEEPLGYRIYLRNR